VYAHNEGGMLGIVADPNAASNKYFYTCIAVATATNGPKDVEVWKWKLTSDTSAVKVRTLIKDIPLNPKPPTSGRHSGCRLRFRSAHRLYVGTGDAAIGTNPQNLNSLGGKVLRVASDGSIPKDNPFYSRGGNARYVWSYGHRNVQGLMVRPGTKNDFWAVEHGPDRDDEINRVWRGHNYGWSPTPGYNESRPMTDKTRFPKAVSARWRSGMSTVATSGGTFISGAKWGSWNGRLAVAMLKGQGILLFTVDSADRVSGKQTLFTSYGRIRTIQQGPDGALYFTTSNGSADGIYKITVG
jgi:glucose/arabinose dehydrogenase